LWKIGSPAPKAGLFLCDGSPHVFIFHDVAIISYKTVVVKSGLLLIFMGVECQRWSGNQKLGG
jgi:hypothetical protein